MGNSKSKSASSSVAKNQKSEEKVDEKAKSEKKLVKRQDDVEKRNAMVREYFENRPILFKNASAFMESLKKGDQSIDTFISRLQEPIPEEDLSIMEQEDRNAVALDRLKLRNPEAYARFKAKATEKTKSSPDLVEALLAALQTTEAVPGPKTVFNWAPEDTTEGAFNWPPHAIYSELPSSQQYSAFTLFTGTAVTYFGIFTSSLTPPGGTVKPGLNSYNDAMAYLPKPKGTDRDQYQTLAYNFPSGSPSGTMNAMVDGVMKGWALPGPWNSMVNLGNMRFNGPSPGSIIVINSDPDKQPKSFSANSTTIEAAYNSAQINSIESYQTALDNGRILWEDYSYLYTQCIDEEFSGPTPNKSNGTWQPGCCAAWYYNISNGALTPFTIRVQVRINGTDYDRWFNRPAPVAPPVTAAPLVEEKKEEVKTDNTTTAPDPVNWEWQYGVNCLQASMWNFHETGAHLTLTHLVEEVFALATKRNLKNNKIYNLLNQHFTKTFAVNQLARTNLAPQQLAWLSGNSLTGNQKAVTYLFNQFCETNFEDLYFSKSLVLRGFQDYSTSYPNYYYAADAVTLWNILYEFTNSWVEYAYESDSAVLSDESLQNWATDIQTNGKMKKFPNFNKTPDQGTARGQLASVLTFIQFNASVQHSAVNYLQAYFLGFLPQCPGFLQGAFPSDSTQFTEQYVFNSLAPAEGYEMATALAGILSQPVNYVQSKEGGFGALLSAMRQIPRPSELDAAFKTLRIALQNMSASVNSRKTVMKNAGLVPYHILDPKQFVATSISI